MREEKDIFDDLSKLCSSRGYTHVVAYFSYRDNAIRYSDKMTADDLLNQFSNERLVRTEISTLIGLMFKEKLDISLPKPEVFQEMIDQTESLLKELHIIMTLPWKIDFDPSERQWSNINPFATGPALREPVFYSGESAYSFQYRDLAIRKYSKDNQWLLANKGFSIEDANSVIKSIGSIHNNKLLDTLARINQTEPHEQTILPAYIFTASEVANISGIDILVTNKILNAFVPPLEISNQDFRSLNDFNITNAYPLIHLGNNEYLLFQYYSIAEALYETPFYWMSSDKSYLNEAMKNRGEFTEGFSTERLELIFSKNRVNKNICILDKKKQRVGEIDILITYADRAIVIQAKSKRLTIEARKGNDKQIKNDFKKSIQDSYDQALLCAKLLTDTDYKLTTADSKEISIIRNFKKIYILCVISDHYPALSFQARQFLQYEQNDTIMAPFIMDVFLLDVMTEMLQSPLYFLSYIDKRTSYSDKVFATHELNVLSYHLKQNLWLDDGNDVMYLADDVSADLDVAMMVRRESIPGDAIPDGILTRLKHTAIGKIIEKIEALEDPFTIELGFFLLTLSEKTVLDTSRAIETMIRMAQSDNNHHDLTIGVRDSGLTIHCNNDPIDLSKLRLRNHCEKRKYSQKAEDWFGLCISPDSNISLRFGLQLAYPWEKSKEMDLIVKDLPKGKKRFDFTNDNQIKTKVGRNDPCPCGSGKKYKKCCLTD